MTVLFRDGKAASDRHADIDHLMINRDRQIITNPLEDLDEEERLAVLTDILNADPVQNELNIIKQDWSQVTNFLGTLMKETLNGYDCQRYKVSVEAQVVQKKKLTKKFEQTYEEYFNPIGEPKVEADHLTNENSSAVD